LEGVLEEALREILMHEQIDHLFKEVRSKLDGAEKRIKDLNAAAKTAAEKARAQAKAEFGALETKAKEHRAKVEAAEAKAKKWMEEKKAATADKIASWKAQHEVKRLDAYAKLAEDYAAASIGAATSAIDEAEAAVVQAIDARLDADAGK
jgi:hypothetical protein